MSILSQVKKPAATILTQGVKFLVYGASGVGKTSLVRTLPENAKTLILSAESGLLSIQDVDVDVLEVKSLSMLRNVFAELRGAKQGDRYVPEHDYTWLVIDSISEIAEVILAEEKAKSKDVRKVYGELAETMLMLIKGFRDMPINVLFLCKEQRIDDDGRQFALPSMPGKKTGEEMPFLLDEVFHMVARKGDDGQSERIFVTSPDERRVAKDRSGKLDQVEPAHIGNVMAKMTSV